MSRGFWKKPQVKAPINATEKVSTVTQRITLWVEKESIKRPQAGKKWAGKNNKIINQTTLHIYLILQNRSLLKFCLYLQQITDSLRNTTSLTPLASNHPAKVA
jgi:hypothetical protein